MNPKHSLIEEEYTKHEGETSGIYGRHPSKSSLYRINMVSQSFSQTEIDKSQKREEK